MAARGAGVGSEGGVIEISVIPTGAERSEAQWRDLFERSVDKKRSLDYARWAAPLGMTGGDNP
jgi:hypothetical protein